MKKIDLSKQLITITLIIFGILFCILGFYIPNILTPIYENNIYYILEKQLNFVKQDVSNEIYNNDVAFLTIVDNNQLLYSSNLNTIISLDAKEVLQKIKVANGTFKYENTEYYYITSIDKNITKIAITNDKYIKTLKRTVAKVIFPILIVTLFLILGILILWIRKIIKKIDHLNNKIKNINNEKYIDKYNFKVEDELKILSDSIEEVKFALKEQNEYKNQMYQSISHDLKTPIAVIKSYVEGIEDGVENTEDGLTIIKEQAQKLETKVHSLLYLNKLNYLEESETYTGEKIDIVTIIKSSVEKFKLQRKEIDFEIQIVDTVNFNGTIDIWEAIIDNLLSNFIRYAESKIKIKIKNGKIVFYNDGPNIDLNIMSDIFNPYKKGLNGQFGLGLSIVKKSVNLVGYEIIVKNERKGVKFIIKPLSK